MPWLNMGGNSKCCYINQWDFFGFMAWNLSTDVIMTLPALLQSYNILRHREVHTGTPENKAIPTLKSGEELHSAKTNIRNGRLCREVLGIPHQNSVNPLRISKPKSQKELRILSSPGQVVLGRMRIISIRQSDYMTETFTSLLRFMFWNTIVQREKANQDSTSQNVCIYRYSSLGPRWASDTRPWFGSYGPQQWATLGRTPKRGDGLMYECQLSTELSLQMKSGFNS